MWIKDENEVEELASHMQGLVSVQANVLLALTVVDKRMGEKLDQCAVQGARKEQHEARMNPGMSTERMGPREEGLEWGNTRLPQEDVNGSRVETVGDPSEYPIPKDDHLVKSAGARLEKVTTIREDRKEEA